MSAEIEAAFGGPGEDLRSFLTATATERLREPMQGTEPALPYFFPTRPYTVREIAELDPRCVGIGSETGESPSELWGRWARAVRGIWTKEGQERAERGRGTSGPSLITLGRRRSRLRPKLCVANLEVRDSSWHAAASGSPDVSLVRYQQLTRLVNAALRTKPRPNYLLLPELSVPHRWLPSLVNKLIGSNVSLIAGVEYKQISPDKVSNQAVLALTDDRLGFDSSVLIWQTKGRPAPGEEEVLLHVHGKQWEPPVPPETARVYRHYGFEFGLLLCSELQEIAFRQAFQGEVDALLVLSWNRDLETFGSLVETGCLDVHAYVALVNNGAFGDSRVRVPAKEHYQRDVCRVRGGLNDYVVVVDLDVAALRRFQSRAKNWPRADDPFKPVPQGFRMAARRRRNPGIATVRGGSA